MRRDELFATDTEAMGKRAARRRNMKEALSMTEILAVEGLGKGQNGNLVVVVAVVAVAAGNIRPWWSLSSVAQKDRPGVLGLLRYYPEKLGGESNR